MATRLPRLAAACGLHATDDIGCASWLQVYSGRIDVQQTGLGFIGSFLPHDPAVAPWRDIGPDARLFMQRLAHVYRRV